MGHLDRRIYQGSGGMSAWQNPYVLLYQLPPNIRLEDDRERRSAQPFAADDEQMKPARLLIIGLLSLLFVIPFAQADPNYNHIYERDTDNKLKLQDLKQRTKELKIDQSVH